MTDSSLFLLSNPTEETLEEDSPVGNDYATTIGALILSLVFLLGVPGNLFIVWSILARVKRRSVTTLLILNLACADGTLMALTIFVVVYLAKQTWIFGTVMCKTLFYLCNANMYASIFLITLMSVHRMVAVLFPHKLHLITRKIVTMVIVGMWALVMIIALPSLVFREVVIEHDELNNTRKACMPLHKQRRQIKFQYSLETISGFVIPYTIIITCYIFILKRLRKTHFHEKVRCEKLILAIVATFGVFWLPYHVINMIQVAAECYPNKSKTKEILDTIHTSCRAVTSAFAFISSCANPVLYTFAGKSYIKQNGLAFMAKLFESSLSEQIKNKRRNKNSKNSVVQINNDSSLCAAASTHNGNHALT